MNTSKEPHSLRILLADDGSEHAQAAIALLNDLPFSGDHRVIDLRIFTKIESSEHSRLQADIEQTKKYLHTKGIAIETETLSGHPAEKIVEYADRHQPDLIVMGAKGLSGTLGILLGGVTQQVVEYAPWPVLVVRAPYTGLQRILLVVDGSSYSEKALKYLGWFPLPAETEVHVLHVLPPASVPLPLSIANFSKVARSDEVPESLHPELPISNNIEARKLQEEREAGEKLLANTIEVLKTYGLQAITDLLRGDAATEIVEYVKKNKISLIIAGSRGHGKVKSWLMGSVSRKLTYYSGCSVLVVK